MERRVVPLAQGLAEISCCVVLTAAIVGAVALFGVRYVRHAHYAPTDGRSYSWLDALCRWDGEWYERVAVEGYSYTPGESSSIAFFPLYPYVARAFAQVTGAPVKVSLVIVSNLALWGACLLLYCYVRGRGGHDVAAWSVMALLLWPTSFFFRMAYSESTLLLMTAAALYLMHRQVSSIIVGGVVGVAVLSRPVGIALWPVMAMYCIERSQASAEQPWKLALGACLSVAGMLGFVCYQWWAFDDPLAFVHVQEAWSSDGNSSWWDRLSSTVSLEVVWGKYFPGSPSYWAKGSDISFPLFSLDFANPLYVAAAWLTLIVGVRCHWLDRKDTVLAAGLLAVPLLSHAARAEMLAQGRYAAAALPLYMVFGRIYADVRSACWAGVLAVSTVLLVVYTMLFAAYYRLI